MPQDREKKRISDRKYAASKKGQLRTKRYLKNNEPEIIKKREELKQRKFEAWCRWHNVDPHCMRRLIAMRKRGVDIEFDAHNARYVYMWESKRQAEKKQKPASVGSSDYY